ncbi:MAG: hypothetical protein ABIR70_08860 [Bryobacteraceae bacterium]
MPIVSRAFVDQAQLAAEIIRIESTLKPSVVRIKATLGEDSSGDPAIYFRVLLSDAASKPARLGDVARRVRSMIVDELDPFNNWGVYPYVRFRSESEQALMKDPDWK